MNACMYKCLTVAYNERMHVQMSDWYIMNACMHKCLTVVYNERMHVQMSDCDYASMGKGVNKVKNTRLRSLWSLYNYDEAPLV